ncbi:MAG: DUF4468 domain-containing protein [Flavipsychrobacter sp.]|nr:DUF4468 domain-containing protein [Flavipsychrobacter sp.]
MKKITLYLSIVIVLLSCSPYKKITNTTLPDPFKFTLVDSIPQTKNQLYVKANSWMAKTLNSAKEVIQMQDKEAGKLIGKAVIQVNGPINGFGQPLGYDYVYYTISIDVKDGKYRCVLSDFYHEGGTHTEGKAVKQSTSYGSLDNKSVPSEIMFSMPNRWDGIKSTAMTRSQNLLEDFKKKMKDKNTDDF